VKTSIVCLNGAPGSGKSTAARYLVDTCGFTLHKIATPLKSMLRCLGLTEEHIEGALKEEPTDLLGGKSPRWAMQTLGKEWRDLIHPDLWLLAWENTRPEGPIVVDDLRYPNEVTWFRERRATILHIHRPGFDLPDTGHEAERQRLPVHATITNNGDIQGLEIIVHKCLREFDALPR
jgi:hypothetical protein